jgi:hypothetical protein
MRGRSKDHPDALSYSGLRNTVASGDVLLYEGEKFFSCLNPALKSYFS